LYAESTDKMRKNETEIDWQREERESTIPGTGPKDSEQPARTAVQAKEQYCSDFSSFLLLPVSCILILSIQGGTERESTQQTEDTRTGCSCRDGGGRPNSERERERSVEWVEKNRKGMGGGKKCQEGEGDREEGGRW
jgi:hypothetical protein